MLETVRAYAADHLSERGETETLIERHADWIGQLATAIWATDDYSDAEASSRGVDRLLRDVDNARAAHTWAIDTNHPDIALGVAAALARAWLSTGGAVEGLRRCEEALALDGGDPLHRILCTLMGSYAARFNAEFEGMTRLALDALAQNDAATLIPPVEVWRNLLGVRAFASREGGPSFEECVARVRAAGADADANQYEGIYRLRTGDPAQALTLFENAGGSHGGAGDLYVACFIECARFEAGGKAEISSALIERIEASGDRQLFSLALCFAARLAAHDDEPFGELVAVAVETARAIGFRADFLAESLAAVAMEARSPEAAALMLGCAGEMTAFLSPRALRSHVRDELGDVEYERLLAESGRLTDDELFALALSLDEL